MCNYEACSNSLAVSYSSQVTKQERIDYFIESGEQTLVIDMVSNYCVDTRTAYLEQEATFTDKDGAVF